MSGHRMPLHDWSGKGSRTRRRMLCRRVRASQRARKEAKRSASMVTHLLRACTFESERKQKMQGIWSLTTRMKHEINHAARPLKLRSFKMPFQRNAVLVEK